MKSLIGVVSGILSSAPSLGLGVKFPTNKLVLAVDIHTLQRISGAADRWSPDSIPLLSEQYSGKNDAILYLCMG